MNDSKLGKTVRVKISDTVGKVRGYCGIDNKLWVTFVQMGLPYPKGYWFNESELVIGE